MTYIATILKKIVPNALIIFVCGYLSAQDADNGETFSIERMLPSNDPVLPNLEAWAQHTASSSNSVYIYQIGDDNVGTVKTNGSNSELKLIQNGNANIANINVSGKTLVHNTLQNGNGNVFLEYGNASNWDLKRNILQNGNNQNVVIFGSNSLTESIRLNVQGDAQSLIIRSFN